MAASGHEVFIDEVRLVLLSITLAKKEIYMFLAFMGACICELCTDHGLSRRLFLPLSLLLLVHYAV